MADKKYLPSGVMKAFGKSGKQCRAAAGAIGKLWGDRRLGSGQRWLCGFAGRGRPNPPPPDSYHPSPYSGPSTVTAASATSESDFQWVQFGLTVMNGATIRDRCLL